MTHWVIEYSAKHNIEKWFNKLTDEQFCSIAKEIELLKLCGNTLRMPHSKALKKGVFELRERKFGFRIYYAFFAGRIILLTAGDKKSQPRDILSAFKIYEEIKYEKI